MATWFEKLKQIINIKIDSFIQINITNNSNNTTFPTNKETPYYFDESKKIIHLNPTFLSAAKQQLLKEIVQENVNEGNKLLEYKTNNLLEELYDYNKNKPHQSILDFFQQIIPKEDYEALEASLFLKEKFAKGESIVYLKTDIKNRFGDRGNNIANLCTARYFETFLIDLYNDNPTNFKKIYEDIVDNSMMALFVHNHTKHSSIPNEISSRLNLAKKYGIKYFHIHGIGKDNITKIKKCIKQQKAYFDFFEKNIFENRVKSIIVVELILK